MLDGTGPRGQGPLTGRGRGYCACPLRQGRFSGGFGFRRFFSSKNELTALQEEEEALKEELSAIREEIASLKDAQK